MKQRLTQKLHKLAYELEWDAARLRKAGWEYEADGIKDIASRLGKIARAMYDPE